MRISWLAQLLLSVASLAFVGAAVLAHQSVGELVERSEQRAHALQTQAQLQRLLTLLVDLETGQRGFIITGQYVFLQPYEAASRELRSMLPGLRQQLDESGSGVGQKRLDELIAQRQQQIVTNIAERERRGDAVLKDMDTYVAGKQLMDEIRRQVRLLQQEQQRHIALAEREARDLQQQSRERVRLLPAAGALLLGIALALLWWERRHRDAAEQALREVNGRLESMVGERTAALSEALRRIQGFAGELDRGIEDERRRLAREVHDQIGQVGTALKMLVIALRKKLHPHPESLLDEMQAQADEAIRSARQISASLRPPLLDDLGLEAALRHHLQTLERQGGPAVHLDLQDVAALSTEQASQLFRILQEGFTNVLRHAQATLLTLRGRQVAEGYEMELIDNGRGPGSVRPDASGLRNMRERAQLAGGRFEFGPAPGGGSRVWVCLPLTRDDGGAAS
ncbi:CHASE3 domain-containing protein [Pelomonas sp. SE-A7]|uniref:CHASE3 domain-containing protein n=1 Tax=Pelomonas sp. SE-A7 TaxID=3054953 RepID=UPI00259CD91C|nr:CHASE3 domain-containing protein [Pelomonas sp. SE-A7]MDM4767614.1 CHASE3 domain-containing protein [Pelomonas sp. SE-A7]